MDRYTTEVVIDQRGTLQLLGNRSDGQGQGQGGQRQSYPRGPEQQGGGYAPGGYQYNQKDEEDDIPF